MRMRYFSGIVMAGTPRLGCDVHFARRASWRGERRKLRCENGGRRTEAAAACAHASLRPVRVSRAVRGSRVFTPATARSLDRTASRQRPASGAADRKLRCKYGRRCLKRPPCRPGALSRLTFAYRAATFRSGPDGRAVALALRRGGGKSGLHDDEAAGNARRGRPQGQRHRKQTAQGFGPGQG